MRCADVGPSGIFGSTLKIEAGDFRAAIVRQAIPCFAGDMPIDTRVDWVSSEDSGLFFSNTGKAIHVDLCAQITSDAEASRLYEQKRRPVSGVPPLEMYVRRWLAWCRGGTQIRIVAPTAVTVNRRDSGAKGTAL